MCYNYARDYFFTPMERHHNHSHLIYNYQVLRFIKDKYNDLLLADTLRTFALSLISLFIPIFLISELKYSLLAVVIMELTIFVGSIACHFLVLRFIGRWGVKRVMILSYIFNVILYLSLFYSDFLIKNLGGYSIICLVAALEILSMAFYWTSHHVYFFSVAKPNDEGREVGLLFAIPSFFGILAPLLGSIMIVSFGYFGVFLFCALLFSLASYILFFTKELHKETRVEFKNIFEWKKIKKNLIFLIHGWTYAATGLFWPLLLFFNSVSLVSLGSLFLFSNLTFSIISYFGGKKMDGSDSWLGARLGAIGQGISLLFRALVPSLPAIAFFQAMGGIFGGFLTITLEADFYKKFHRQHGNAIMNRELYMYAGRIMSILVFLFLLSVFNPVKALMYMLIASAILLFVLSVVAKKNCFE